MTPDPPALVSWAVATANMVSFLSLSVTSDFPFFDRKDDGRHRIFVTEDPMVMTCFVIFD